MFTIDRCPKFQEIEKKVMQSHIKNDWNFRSHQKKSEMGIPPHDQSLALSGQSPLPQILSLCPWAFMVGCQEYLNISRHI